MKAQLMVHGSLSDENLESTINSTENMNDQIKEASSQGNNISSEVKEVAVLKIKSFSITSKKAILGKLQ